MSDTTLDDTRQSLTGQLPGLAKIKENCLDALLECCRAISDGQNPNEAMAAFKERMAEIEKSNPIPLIDRIKHLVAKDVEMIHFLSECARNTASAQDYGNLLEDLESIERYASNTADRIKKHIPEEEQQQEYDENGCAIEPEDKYVASEKNPHYSLTLEWSPSDRVYRAILPEWQSWLLREHGRYGIDGLPPDLVPVVYGKTLEETARRAESEISGLVGFCIGDGHPLPPTRTTTQSPIDMERKQKQEASEWKQDLDEGIAKSTNYDPSSGLDLSSWAFCDSLAQAKIDRENITDSAKCKEVYDEMAEHVRQTIVKIQKPSTPAGPYVGVELMSLQYKVDYAQNSLRCGEWDDDDLQQAVKEIKETAARLEEAVENQRKAEENR